MKIRKSNSFHGLIPFWLVPTLIYGGIKMNSCIVMNQYEWVWWVWIGVTIITFFIFGFKYKK